MSLLGPILAGGAKLVAGFFAKKDAEKQAKEEKRAIKNYNKKQEELTIQMNKEARARADAAALVPVQRASYSYTSGDVDTDKLLADAEKLGMNPISYIRSGAASLYTQTSAESFDCTTGERAMEAAQAGQYFPQLMPVMSQTQVPSMGSVVGDAAMAGVNQYLQDKSVAENNAFQMQLLNRQLQGVNASGYGGSRSLYVPSATIAGPSRATPGGGELASTTVWVIDANGKKTRVANTDVMPDPETDIYEKVKRAADYIFDPYYGPTSKGTTRAWDWLIENQGQGWDIMPDWPGSYGGRGNTPAKSKQK